LAGIDRAKIVDVETRSPKGTIHRLPIWIVTVDGAPYVRSVRGERGRWYREILARREGALHVGGIRVPVRPVHVRSDETIRAVSAALRKKYGKSGSLDSMLVAAVLPTTLRLEPAA
jgi:hypothetical protein